MRVLFVPFAMLSLGMAACGALTGLGAYSEESADGGSSSVGTLDATSSSGGGADGAGGGSSGGDDTTEPLGDDAADVLAMDETGDDAPVGDANVDATTEMDDGGGMEASTSAPDSGVAPKDAAPPPTCSSSNCSGCCNGTTCVTSQSASTCGTGGASCRSCSGSTPVCTSGSCVAPPCNPSSCPQTCIPFYQMACCKSDNACGCEVTTTNNCN